MQIYSDYVWDVDVVDTDRDGDLDIVVGYVANVSILDNVTRSSPIDDDGDGLSSAVEECVSNTDPSVFDTDGGGVGDGLELFRLTDPQDATDD